jgi:hypothetical protein
MKRAILFTTLAFAAAGAYAFFQTVTPAPKLATLMPGGALLYLEAPNFGGLLRDWDQSQVKTDWLASTNYEVFSRSNLFTKLQEVYNQYGEAAGFVPGLKGAIELAGTDSALALYQIRDVEFLYISRISDADLMKSQLWTVRNKFEQRQAGGEPFYLRTDPGSKRTVAFAFVKGYLLLATRDDLVAQSLELLAGGSRPTLAADRWYQEAVAAKPEVGELRVVMNLEALVKSVYFRSYWVQRNASVVRQYWAGVADAQRSGGNITETRVFLKSGQAAPSGVVSSLLGLVPPEAGLYKAMRASSAADVAALIVAKLIGPQSQQARDWREAPAEVSPDNTAGNEGDLETRIDEQPLPADAGVSDSIESVRALVAQGGGRSVLLVQSSVSDAGTFVHLPSVIVLEGSEDWAADSVRTALGVAAGKLWTTSQLGAGWVSGTSGTHAVERLDGLGTLLSATRGRLLFLSDDTGLLRAVLDRTETNQAAGGISYAAGFRHLRERSNYERVMAALDFTSPAGTPSFFSGNIGSLSRVLSRLSEVRFTEEERGNVTMQTVVYSIAQ